MSVELCSETKPLSEASELVKALGDGEAPGEGGDEALTDTSGVVPARAIIGLAGLAMAASLLVMAPCAQRLDVKKVGTPWFAKHTSQLWRGPS